MAIVSVTSTEVNRVYLSMDYIITNTSLRTNSQSPFTLHYAIWPFIGLISLIVTVWLVVYISASIARRYSLKNEQRNFASLYVTQNSTTFGGYEASTVMSPTNV